ncbi:Protein kinase [Chondrus crispus]|uniref:Protein kinase n=1 Tax=Chondrus crispus TaxID=2769 RepID=R7QQR6_CHOCR|nr:Protein kinase [Chondrus crispus]CDF39730.1 Protein kinase [Chondrus crispus]|eukprot:XP_005710024.1 Protein kinase [Chondrus crispus]
MPSADPAPPSDASDYSDVGDYSADEDFYVPGVNDPSSSGSTPLAFSAASHPAPPPYPSSEESDHSSNVVRQDSNFSRLSAQSWLTVDSAQDVDEPHLLHPRDPAVPQPAAATPFDPAASATAPRDAPIIPDRKFPGADRDRDPSTLFDVDIEAELLQTVQSKPLAEMSVFECCAVLQAGVPAYKKKSFRRFGARRVWLSPECDRLLWTSKKDGVTADHIKLQKVAKMKCADREVSVDVTEGYRISLLFGNPEEAGMWVRALSCLIPLQARVRAPKGVVPPDKDREDYTLIDDVFDNRPLRDRIAVNSYIVLCSANKQPPQMGNKLAFSRSEASFCGLRYIPYKLVPLLLRSQEEIAVLKRLDHPNVVKYHECLQDQEHGGNYVIFEYLAKGSIMDSTKLEGVAPIREATAREYIRDVVNGLEYLHSLRIAHGDVRPDNLLRSVNGAIKINPLGCITHDFTEIQNGPALVRARLGEASPAFLAPELCWLSDAPSAHSKSYAMDVWAVGVVLYFMLYGRVPFGGRDNHAIQESICKGKLRFPRHPETSRKVRSLLKGVLGEKDPKTRIALSELQRHPWFSEADNKAAIIGDASREPTRLIVSPEEVDSAVQVAKVGVTSRKR